MDKYIERCVVVDAEIGYRFTIEDIARSNDLFGFMTEKAGTFRLVDFMVNQKPSRLNCKQATAQLKHYFKSERDFLNFKYKGTDYSIAGSRGVPVNINEQANTMLMKNLEVAYGSTLGVNGSASDIMTQLMFINAMYDYANNADTYGYTRADQLQKSNWQISRELAKEYLPLLLNIMKAKIQGSHDTISTRKENMTQNATNQIKSVEDRNTTLERGMNKKIDQYEKDRIGQGKVAQGMSAITDNIPFTNLGRIGGPNSTQKAEEYLKGDNKAPQLPNVKTLENSGEK